MNFFPFIFFGMFFSFVLLIYGIAFLLRKQNLFRLKLSEKRIKLLDEQLKQLKKYKAFLPPEEKVCAEEDFSEETSELRGIPCSAEMDLEDLENGFD